MRKTWVAVGRGYKVGQQGQDWLNCGLDEERPVAMPIDSAMTLCDHALMFVAHPEGAEYLPLPQDAYGPARGTHTVAPTSIHQPWGATSLQEAGARLMRSMQRVGAHWSQRALAWGDTVRHSLRELGQPDPYAVPLLGIFSGYMPPTSAVLQHQARQRNGSTVGAKAPCSQGYTSLPALVASKDHEGDEESLCAITLQPLCALSQPVAACSHHGAMQVYEWGALQTFWQKYPNRRGATPSYMPIHRLYRIDRIGLRGPAGISSGAS